MTTKEFYLKVGGDWQDELKRFGSEELVKRFIYKFVNDKSMAELRLCRRRTFIPRGAYAQRRVPQFGISKPVRRCQSPYGKTAYNELRRLRRNARRS